MRRAKYIHIFILSCLISPLKSALAQELPGGSPVFDIEEQANTPVIANNDFSRTFKMTPIEINITKNDYGISVGISKIELVMAPTNGTATISSKHTIIYTPADYYSGPDSLTYRICNSSGFCGVARVNIIVDDYDFAPIAYNDTVILYQTKDVSIEVLKNDKYLYDLPLSVEIINNFNNSAATVSDKLTILPNINRHYTEADSLLYRVCDREGDCDEAWLFVSLSEKVEQKFFIPQGFSPNGDGINDSFHIPDFQNVAEMSIRIFNRVGLMVYEDLAYNNYWDGRANTGIYDGQELESGTYYYLIEIKGLDTFRGFVYISKETY